MNWRNADFVVNKQQRSILVHRGSKQRESLRELLCLVCCQLAVDISDLPGRHTHTHTHTHIPEDLQLHSCTYIAHLSAYFSVSLPFDSSVFQLTLTVPIHTVMGCTHPQTHTHTVLWIMHTQVSVCVEKTCTLSFSSEVRVSINFSIMNTLFKTSIHVGTNTHFHSGTLL